MLTVMTWLWQQPNGRAKYTSDHVNIWADMVSRNLSLPHRLACVTDIPDGLDSRIEVIEPPKDFENVVIPTWEPPYPQCLRRIAMFAPDAGKRFGDRFVSMDTDCVIHSSLDPLFERTEDFVMYRGTTDRRPYNGSMLMMNAGARPQVYERFSPELAVEAGEKYVGSDQAWISYVLGFGEATWGAEHGVMWYGSRIYTEQAARITFFPGNPKPWQLKEHNDYPMMDTYRRSWRGKVLILGYGETLWDDVEEALNQHPEFGSSFSTPPVIASPEAAEHWPGDVLAIANDDRHAERLAHMHGFNEVIFCGRS